MSDDLLEVLAAVKIPGAGIIGRTAARYILQSLEVAQLEIVRKERTFPDREGVDADGMIRKAHYGDGKQPWDHMVEVGWAPHFAAGCILRYLRRDKDRRHSLESARWYTAQLHNLAIRPGYKWSYLAVDSMAALRDLLTEDEMMLLVA